MIPTKTILELRWEREHDVNEKWVSVDVLRQKLHQLEQNNNNDFVNFDLVGFLEGHGVKYDNWLKLQLFDLISSLQQKVKARIDEVLVGLEPEEVRKP